MERATASDGVRIPHPPHQGSETLKNAGQRHFPIFGRCLFPFHRVIHRVIIDPVVTGEWTAEKRAAASARASKTGRRAKGEGTLFRTTVRGEKVWRARVVVYDDNGVRKEITATSADKSTALALRNRKHNIWLVQQGREDPSVLRDEDAPRVWTVGEWLDDWAEKQSTEDVQGNTRQRNRGLIKNHITPHIGTKKLRALKDTDVLTLLKETLPAKRTVEGKKMLGSSPLRAVYYILKNALTEAERQKLINSQPMKFIDPPRKDKHRPDLRERIEDIPKLKSYLNKRPAEYAHWALAFWGLRASERLGLEWSSFTNLHTNLRKPAYITIDRQLYNDAESRTLSIKKQTKTEAGKRKFMLPDEVRSLLIQHKKAQAVMKKTAAWKPSPGFENLVYTTSTGNPVRQSKDNARWKKLLGDVGLDPLREHDLRHLTASYLNASGVTAEVAKTLLGHTSEAMTGYYTHISDTQQSEAIRKLSALYNKVTSDYAAGKVDTPHISLIKDFEVEGLNALDEEPQGSSATGS